MYADDTQIYSTFIANDDEDLAATKLNIEMCLIEVEQWMTINKLKLNNDKTKLLVFHSRHRPFTQLTSIVMGNETIYPSSHAGNLGVIFDDTMTMTRHVNSRCKSAYYQLRNIAKIRKYLSLQTAEIITHAFVTSKLDNCNSLLHGLPKYLIQKLQHVQNAAARMLTFKKKFDHISPTLRELHWLTIEKRIIFKILLLTYKSLNNLAPAYLGSLTNIYKPNRLLRSSADTLRLERPLVQLKTYGQRSFSISAPELWNDLPYEIRQIPNLDLFKYRLKTYLFELP